MSVFRFSAWEYREERGQFYLHQFVKGQPDLNYRNPKVMEEMLDVFRFWLDLGVDGFRMDAVSGLNIFDNWQMIPSRMGQTNSITIKRVVECALGIRTQCFTLLLSSK